MLHVFAISALLLSQPTQKKIHQIVFEVNVPGTIAYNNVLNNIENLKKAFAPDEVRVEVICHGEGINMILLSKIKPPSMERMKKLIASSVVFAACNNTMHGRHISRNQIVPFATVVDAGVAEVVRKEEAGWSYIKGAF